jgi:hypothetical protein
MLNRHPATKWKKQPRIVAAFGRAILVKLTGANYELRDASHDEFTAAKEWVSLFMHEACVQLEPPAPPSLRPQSRATSNSRWKVSSLGKSA